MILEFYINIMLDFLKLGDKSNILEINYYRCISSDINDER